MPADLSNIIEIYSESIQSLAVSYYSPEQIAAWAPAEQDTARWQERLANLDTLVAEMDGVVAGFVSYTDEGYLDFLFTHPQFARRGVATCLCRRVESALRALGIGKVSTHASLAARAFFDQQGFRVDAEESVECRGVSLRRFAMHKELADEWSA